MDNNLLDNHNKNNIIIKMKIILENIEAKTILQDMLSIGDCTPEIEIKDSPKENRYGLSKEYLNQLAKQLAPEYEGRLIAGVKKFRQLTGVGLKEAKQCMEFAINNIGFDAYPPF